MAVAEHVPRNNSTRDSYNSAKLTARNWNAVVLTSRNAISIKATCRGSVGIGDGSCTAVRFTMEIFVGDVTNDIILLRNDVPPYKVRLL